MAIPIEAYRLPNDLNIPYDFTVHDYYTYCPQVSLSDIHEKYCGEPDLEFCEQCFRQRPLKNVESIAQWRSRHKTLLESADRVFVPSHYTAKRILKHFPQSRVIVVSHPDEEQNAPYPQPVISQLKEGKPLRILVLGALSPVKGADLLEKCALESSLKGLPLEYELLGHAYRKLIQYPISHLKIHGPYKDSEIEQKIKFLSPDIIWFPAQWPETYSYTLSVALKLGFPVATTDLGAIPERLEGRRYSWSQPWNSSYTEWNNFFIWLRQEYFCLGKKSPKFSNVAFSPKTSHFSYVNDYLKSSDF